MKIILHDLKVAVRNLMKYKVQTTISVLSIAIGIVTLSFAHSLISRCRLPQIFDEPYADRAYTVKFRPTTDETKRKVEETKRMLRIMELGEEYAKIDVDIIRALKRNGGLRNVEKIAVPNVMAPTLPSEFHLSDSTIRQGNITGQIMDPYMPDYSGLTSAITGKKIGVLKAGEAIISEEAVKRIFGDKNPLGAIQTATNHWQPIPVTVKDVYASTSILEPYFTNCDIFYSISDAIEDNYEFQFNFSQVINIVLKKGSTQKELQKEIDSRLAPLGYKSELEQIAESPTIKKAVPIRILVNFIGSLILIAAIIGFLRIEIQLFHARRRELALRITNGAKRQQVFVVIFAEIAIVIVLAIIIALIFGILLQNFYDTKFINFMNNVGYKLRISDLWLNSMVIGSGILIICSLIAWISLGRIDMNGTNLVANMQKSRSHLFRNAMLCIQIVICIVFVCCALSIYKATESILQANNIPENDAVYSKYLYITPYSANEPEKILNEIKALPDIEKMLMYCQFYTALKELADDYELAKKLDGNVYYQFYAILDTTVLSTLGLQIKWNNDMVDKTECFILSDKTLEKFKEYGILDHSTLTMKYSKITLPIAGTIQNMPYESEGGEFIIAIYPRWEKSDYGYILIPKEGREKALEQSVKKTIERLEPQAINEMVFNFREHMNSMLGLAETVRFAGWILGIVCLIICAMSIFSTITLDTRTRRKEVAIRKINGAKNGDIYRMFGKTYLSLIGIALIISVPLSVWFNRLIGKLVKEIVPSSIISPVGPILIGLTIVILLILIIISWQIQRVLQVDTAKIIAKE